MANQTQIMHLLLQSIESISTTTSLSKKIRHPNNQWENQK